MTTTAAHFRPSLEVKLAGTAGLFEGYASTFGGEPDVYGDTIAAGCFARTLAEHRARGTMPALLWAHNPDEPIGAWLSLAEDAKGLKVEGRLALDVQRAAEARALMAHGALGLSIGFATKRAERTAGGGRLVQDVDLFEISAVALPANRNARIIGVKSAASITDARSYERFLIESGFPRAMAKQLTAAGWKGAGQVDQASEAAELVAALQSATQQLRS